MFMPKIRARPHRQVGMGRGYAKYLSILPAVVLFILFFILPAAGNIYFSMTDYFGNPNIIEWVGMKHYVSFFTRQSVQRDLKDAIDATIQFCLGVTIPQNIIAVLLAVLVNMRLRLKGFYRAVLFLPNVLGIVVIGLTWRLMLSPSLGIVNAALRQFFNIDSALLGDQHLAMPLVIFVQLWISIGYAMTIYVAGLQTIPQEIMEAAKVDGASPWQSFLSITLPMIQPAITINLLLSLIGTLRTIDTIYVLTNLDRATMTLGVMVFGGVMGSGNQGFSAAVSILHFLFTFILVFISQYYLRRRERSME